MTVSGLMEAMAAAGAPMEAIVLAVRALEAKDAELKAAEQQAADKRAAHAAWKKARRAELSVSMDSPRTVDGHSTETPSPSSSPDPSNNPTPVHTHGNPASARSAWACPDGVEPRHWSDFLANRKRKRLTNSDTAREGVLADLANLADNDWPPGRLVQLAAAKGWGSINYPSDGPRHAQRNPTHGRQQSNDGLGPTARAALRVIGGS